jgi:iron transport multicopper oxidase
LRTWLVIRGNEDYRYDEEYVLALSDWYHQEHSVNILEFMNPENPDGLEPVPNSLIVNDQPDNRFTMVPGRTYRFRIIGMMTFASIDFWIDGHNMTIIEADGVSTEPYETNVLRIASAQRYSILVTALDSKTLNYLMHFSLNEDMFKLIPEVYQQETTALLVYGKNVQTYSTNVIPNADLFEEMNLHPLQPEAPLIPTFTKRLDVIFNMFTDDLNHGTFNNTVFQFPIVALFLT